MKKTIFSLFLVLSSTFLFAQDVVYGITVDGSSSAAYKFSGVNPTTGANFSSTVTSTTSISDEGSAALGLNADGSWLYYIEYGSGSEGEGNGILDIHSIKVDGTGDNQPLNDFDMNGGSNNNELSFVRLGIDANNKGWIVAKQSDNTLYLACFDANGSGGVSNALLRGTLATSDNTNSVFDNGDLALDGSGGMFLLANVSGGVTKIYKITGTALNATTSL